MEYLFPDRNSSFLWGKNCLLNNVDHSQYGLKIPKENITVIHWKLFSSWVECGDSLEKKQEVQGYSYPWFDAKPYRQIN